MTTITTVEQLESLYGTPGAASKVKEIDWISDEYAALIKASPFVALATAGPEGLDCSPRGDRGEVVRILDARRVALPDRRGNDRIDSLRNIVRDPRVALLFLIPGSGTTLRLNGRATISADPQLLEDFAVDGKAPRSVILIEVERVYFQCARAIVRSRLWERDAQEAANGLPTPGAILSALSEAKVGGEAYDREWPERARKTLW
ncbi:pyridoxamine 5'-phosphate oxidase family protein [Stappia sp. WLB 29]|uniref:pyridoxamine 5'-phosphate oxidase family protein n=1 Tax=Stappia sp. WLB 29 TaxID=2925220 RepID=UPI0020BF59E0|nr:pyridoxamine 5'-phosphate oxidase family protein [Stappia sp. WLB 29]